MASWKMLVWSSRDKALSMRTDIGITGERQEIRTLCVSASVLSLRVILYDLVWFFLASLNPRIAQIWGLRMLRVEISMSYTQISMKTLDPQLQLTILG